MGGVTHAKLDLAARTSCLLMLIVLGLGAMPVLRAATLNPSLLPRVEAATFQVVAAKPTHSQLTYAKPLPLNLLPFQQRNDKYYQIGTAFAIGPNRYVTAAHVLLTSRNSLWGPLSLRDSKGHVYAIDKIEKFALRRDFAVFSLAHPPASAAHLLADTHPELNQSVYAVGNALGAGVAIRAGLYTSNTPEQQSGAWNWLRFSAAASPGDSGGPLLDQNGKVIGVILAASGDENLNYALPISEVLNAPADLARFSRRSAYGFDLVDSTLTDTIHATFKLPKTLAEFDAAVQQQDDGWEDHELNTIMTKQADRMFPEGDGSHRVLEGMAPMRPMPDLLVRNSAGTWLPTPPPHKSEMIPLQDNGYVLLGRAPNTTLFHLRKPDNISAAQLYGHPRELMDLLLKAGFMRRDVASAKVKITSFGPPQMDQPFTDRWQRHWRELVWTIPFADNELLMMALPVPDGYVGMFRSIKAPDRHVNLTHLEAMTGFFNTTYNGTLAQWHDYLQQTALLPAALQHIEIVMDYDKLFSYASPNLRFSFTPALQKIESDSRLTLGLGFFKDTDGKITLGVDDIRVSAKQDDRDWINIQRNAAPTADMDAAFQTHWSNIVQRQPPWDGVAGNREGVTHITQVVPSTVKPAKVLYTVFYGRNGTYPQATMKSGLAMLMKHFKILDPEH